MKKLILRIFIAILSILGVVIWVLFLNSHLSFLPDEITVAVDDFCYKLFNKNDEIEVVDTSDYVLLSTLSDSPLFENMDLSVPNDTYIPSKEEISKTYSGLCSDTVVAAFTNYDIIIQDYGIDVTDDLNLIDFRAHVVASLKQSRPDIEFDTSFTLTKDDMEIPIIEFSTTHNELTTYSFIAFVDVNGKFVTVSVNSADYYFDASQFFGRLINDMVIK